MRVAADTLRELLVAAGVAPATARAVQPGLPLRGQGVDFTVHPAFRRQVEERFGLALDETGAWPLETLDEIAACIRARQDGEPAKAELAALIERVKRDWQEVEPGLDYEVGPLRPGDGQGVSQLFYSVYGDRYPVADYYIPEAIERLNAEGKLLTVVARLSSGAIAGQGAYYRSSPPNEGVFENGQVLIVPEYRGSRIVVQITRAMDRLSRSMQQAQGFFGEAVCTHLTTQKLCSRQDYSECGLELSLMPAGSYEKEGAGLQRVSCLIGARVDRDRHATLHLPECYRTEMEFILSGFALDREILFSDSDAPPPTAGSSRLEARTFDFAQVERVQVIAIGADFPERVRELDENAKRCGLAVVQAFVNTGDAGAPFAVNALRARGFILGGFVPLWFGPDGVLMQKLYVEPEFDAVNLFAERSKRIFAFIRADWDRAQACARGGDDGPGS